MTSLNLIIKAIESLQNLQGQKSADSDFSYSKKDKISNCITIANGICFPTSRIAPKFSQVLSLSFEILLFYCDDDDSDVRTVADECLNRIIRALADTHMVKIQIELYQEIKRNRSVRSLKAALWRFGVLSHTIRAIKGKAYVSNLIPCIVTIMKRQDNTLIETLAQSLPLILKSLGPFLTDKDVKIILRAFFSNLSSTEATFRRAAACMILTTCLNCRKPQMFLGYVLDNLISTAVQAIEIDKESAHIIMGIFNCFRLLLPYMSSPLDDESERVHRVESLMQIYELCLHYIKWHSNHNVINAALETLSQLLQSSLEDFLSILLSENGIGHSRISFSENIGKISLGNLSLSATTISCGTSGSTLNLLEPELQDMPDITPRVKKWISDSEGILPSVEKSFETEVLMESVEMTGKIIEDYSNLTIGSLDNDNWEGESDLGSEIVKSVRMSDLLLPNEHMKLEEGYFDDTIVSVDSPQRSLVNAPLPEFDIGQFTDLDIPLKYCCRYLASTFLLTGKIGQLVPDKVFRVSVKSLALTCITNILKICPNLFFISVARIPTGEYQQSISDILLFSDHSDPQLKGNVSMAIGILMKSILVMNGGFFYNEEIKRFEEINHKRRLFQELIDLLLKGLEDNSATTCRQTLDALGVFMTELLESGESQGAIQILYKLPQIANNPYFLVRIKLIEFLSELSYINVEHITGDSQFQEVVINLCFQLLGDQDQRVRCATSSAIVKILPSLYYRHPQEDALTRKASLHIFQYLSTVISDSMEHPACYAEHKLLINSLIKPYDALYMSKRACKSAEVHEALSRMVNLLFEKLAIFSSNSLVHGCCETLNLLSEAYSTVTYSSAWNCYLSKYPSRKTHKKSSSKGDTIESNFTNDMPLSVANSLLSLSINLLSSSTVSLSLGTHRHLLLLAGNIAAGMAVCNLKPGCPTSKDEPDSVRLWGLYNNKQMYQYLESLLTHVIRLLNIFVHVIEDIPMIVQPVGKSSLSHHHTGQSSSPKKKLTPDYKVKDKADRFLPLRLGKEQVGVSYNNSHYLKMYEILRTAHANYNVTLVSEASKMYLSLLNATLQVLSQLLEVATIIKAGKIAEEVLHYLETTFILSPIKSVQCVQQLLKCLFGTNLSAHWNDLSRHRNSNTDIYIYDDDKSFHNQCFQTPARVISETIKFIGNNIRGGNDPDAGWTGFSRKRSDRKITTVFKTLTKSLDKKASVESFIRLFEPMVIKSLKQYTVTSDVSLQCQVLMLLSQLVQLHINYCMLDSDQIFIGFVIKQFEFIDEGQITDVEVLLPRIFEFLVRLSYEEYHTKNIIGIPKIIQLCDGLMASGQQASTHCIPALIPVVEDIFLMRKPGSSVTELKELETTREVLISMLLKLVENPEIIQLLTICLTESRFNHDGNGEEKWRRWSRTVMDTLLPMLAAGKIITESRDAHVALLKLCATVSPTVFRPVDPLLTVLLTPLPSLHNHRLIKLERWLGTINIILLCLISYAKEEAMLARLADLSPNITDITDIVLLPEAHNQTRDPLNAIGNQLVELQPERILARFIFEVIKLLGAKLSNLKNSAIKNNLPTNDSAHHHLIHQSTLFLQICIHMFESGSHCRVANASMQLLLDHGILIDEERIPLDYLNSTMLQIGKSWPLITCQWVYLMTLLSYSEMSFWSRVLCSNYKNNEASNTYSGDGVININIIRRGGTILFCDYVCENLNNTEPLNWLLVNLIKETIQLATEPPVKELIAVAVHRNSVASALIIQAIASKCLDLSKPSFVKRLLMCVEGAHHSQSGDVILALVPRLLMTKYLALSRMAANIVSRRIEILLTLSAEEVNAQLPRDKLIKIMDIFLTTKLSRKYGSLVSLLNKLGSEYYDLSPLQFDQCRLFNPSVIRNIELDRNWFLSQVRLHCCYSNTNEGNWESAQLLSNLTFEECLDIFSFEDFNLKILKDCIKLGLQLTIESCQEMEFSRRSYQEKLDYKENPLYSAAKKILLQHIQSINQLVPKPHLIFNPQFEEASAEEREYTLKFIELLSDTVYQESLFTIIPAVTAYFSTLPKISKYNLPKVDPSFDEDLAKFVTLCLETTHLIFHNDESGKKKLNPTKVRMNLSCVREIFNNSNQARVLGLEVNYLPVCSMTMSLMRIVEHFQTSRKVLSSIDNCGLEAALDNEKTKPYAQACIRMAILVSWMEKYKSSGDSPRNIPSFVLDPIESLIVNISRLPLVNSFVMMPPLVWKNGYQILGAGPTRCFFPLLYPESNFFHEVDILQQFIFRINILGWTSKSQFEEIWMSLLSVVNTLQNENILPENSSELSQATCLSVQAITRLLMQTLLLPSLGNPARSCPIHHPRDPQLSLSKRSSRKLFSVQDSLVWKYESMNEFKNPASQSLDNVFSRGNIEQSKNPNELSNSQLSVAFLWSLCSLHQDKLSSSVLTLKNERDEALLSSALDIESCLRFLLELYSSWLNNHNGITTLCLLKETIKSIISISELFVERAQHRWMLDSCLELFKYHSTEDEILHQYLTIAICKAAAVLTPLDFDTLEKIKRLLNVSLKSGFLPTRISALHGILYLLQSAVLVGCEETMNIVHPLAIEYIQKHIDSQDPNRILCQSEEHQGIMWALVFFLLEHTEDTPPDSEAPAVLELALALVMSQKISIALHQTLLKGLERLVVTRSVIGKVSDQIVKIAIDRLKQTNALLALPALQLLLTCMYTEAVDKFNQSVTEEPSSDLEPEALVRSIERTSVMFDKIKRGYPMEVEIICTVLARVLGDFFPPSEILTKVIGEFLSPQQPHPRLMSAVVFEVCGRACDNNQLSLLQDWVVFSLPNFIQSLPVIISTWSLSCFFISVSTNRWLRALFPHVQSRIGRYEYEDKKILCIAASNFYSQLSHETQKKTFVESFKAVAKEPETPFADILSSL